jgi:hypothetical protein
MLTHIHPAHVWFTCKPSSFIKGTGCSSSRSGPAPEPPSAQSPFAHLGRYLRRRDVEHLVRGRYPSFIAHTDSCVRPKSSFRLRLSLVRPVFAGCCRPLLEDGPSRRYLHNLCKGAWTLTPPRSSRSRSFGRPTSPDQTLRPTDIGLATWGHELGTRKCPCNATSTGSWISGLQSFANVQAPLLARPPGCTYRCVKHRAARPFTSRNGHVVTRLEHTRFYMNCDIATYPKRTN